MADLNYNDMQRAVGEGMNQLRASLDDLRARVAEVSRDTDEVERMRQQIEETLRRTMNLEQMVNQLAQQMQYTQQAVANAQRASQMDVSISQQVTHLNARFQAVEKFAQDMSNYMQQVRSRDDDDRGYKNVTG